MDSIFSQKLALIMGEYFHSQSSTRLNRPNLTFYQQILIKQSFDTLKQFLPSSTKARMERVYW